MFFFSELKLTAEQALLLDDVTLLKGDNVHNGNGICSSPESPSYSIYANPDFTGDDSFSPNEMDLQQERQQQQALGLHVTSPSSSCTSDTSQSFTVLQAFSSTSASVPLPVTTPLVQTGEPAHRAAVKCKNSGGQASSVNRTTVIAAPLNKNPGRVRRRSEGGDLPVDVTAGTSDALTPDISPAESELHDSLMESYVILESAHERVGEVISALISFSKQEAALLF